MSFTNLPARCRLALPGLALLGVLTIQGGCATASKSYQNQTAFTTPEEVVASLQLAVSADDTATLESLFGPDGKSVLSSGDPVTDANEREVFSVALQQTWSLNRIDGHTRELLVGHERWPFPIPIVKDRHGWWFDTEAGRLEVLARRIGRNELAAIDVLKTYFVAQVEYAAVGHDGKPAGLFAQKVRSDDGQHNGLFWPTADADDELSPLGEFAASALAQGYTASKPEGMNPYHGYYFQILKKQGASAPGGAMDYVVNGEMSGGFAMVAFPAEYENSGIMTFMVGPDGVIYERDFGADTIALARALDTFNPGPEWSPVD